MFSHKFAAGQTVYFSPGPYGDDSARGCYRIVRLLPEADGLPQYRIKSEADDHERVVREDQIRLITGLQHRGRVASRDHR
jgi:hypothetical protein